MRLSQTILLAAILAPALSRTAGRAQTAPTLKVYTRETIVDITVTDAKGNPVYGLKQEDFTVKEDNKPQPIRSFAEYGSQPIPPPPKLPPNVYTNLQPPPTSSATNLFLLDFTNAAPMISVSCCNADPSVGPKSLARAIQRQRLVKQEAMKYLKTMPPGTRIAVLGASYPSTLRTLQGVTSDPALLSAAVDTMQYDTDAMASNFSMWCTQQEQRNRMTLESLNQIAASAAGIKGRKNLLWFTIGIPFITEPEARPPCLTDLTPDLHKAYGLLTAAEVTVFPIWVRGVPAEGDPFGENWSAEELSMESVAEATGGKAYYNSNDLAPLIAKAIAAGSDYYTLSYVPPGTAYDGRHHTIKLAVDRPDLHLTYRDEYYAEDPAKMSPTPGLTLATTPPPTIAANMQASMGRSMPTSQQLLFDVQVEPSPSPSTPPILGTLDAKLVALSTKNTKLLTRYAFQYAIPASQITFTNNPNGIHKGAMELDIAAYDAEGHLVTGLSQTVQMPLSDARYQQFIQGPFRFFQQLDLPAGPLFLRIGIFDTTSNKIGTLEIPLTVPKK